MKKYITFLTFISFSVFYIFAVNVDEKEVRSRDSGEVDFVNYTGKHDEIDSVEAIRGIGRGLAGAVKSGKVGSLDRYMVIHVVDSTVKEGLDADILILGKSVRVDHIDNLRLIIEGYLSSSYNYSRQDAKTLAHFITIYNAVYRGKIDVFNKKYKSIVLTHLDASKVGLSTTYSQWPGNTQIVIPLSDQKYSGTISSVDTGTISDKEVIEKMKEQDDKDIDARKDMVDLKEKEAEEARKRAEEAKEKQAEKEKEAKDAKKASDDAKKKESEKEKALKDKEKALEKAKDDPAKAKKAEEEAEKARKEKEEAQAERLRKEEEAKKKQEEAEKLRKEAEEEEKFADEKEDDAQGDRKDIAKDTQKIIEDKKAEKKAETDALIASATRGYALKVVDEQTLSSSIVMLDLRSAKQIKTSSLNTIKGRRIYAVGDNILAIAGSSDGNGVVSLVLINQRSLEVAKQGGDELSENSVLVKDGDYYYAVVSSGGKYYIGKFNEELTRQALSATPVSKYTPITVTEHGLLVQDASKNIYLLDKNSLKDVMEDRKSYTSFKNETDGKNK